MRLQQCANSTQKTGPTEGGWLQSRAASQLDCHGLAPSGGGADLCAAAEFLHPEARLVAAVTRIIPVPAACRNCLRQLSATGLMMTTFILTFLLMTLVMLGMALGVMVNGKRIKGSCGGLSSIPGGDKCAVCPCKSAKNGPSGGRSGCRRAGATQML